MLSKPASDNLVENQKFKLLNMPVAAAPSCGDFQASILSKWFTRMIFVLIWPLKRNKKSDNLKMYLAMPCVIVRFGMCVNPSSSGCGVTWNPFFCTRFASNLRSVDSSNQNGKFQNQYHHTVIIASLASAAAFAPMPLASTMPAVRPSQTCV